MIAIEDAVFAINADVMRQVLRAAAMRVLISMGQPEVVAKIPLVSPGRAIGQLQWQGTSAAMLVKDVLLHPNHAVLLLVTAEPRPETWPEQLSCVLDTFRDIIVTDLFAGWPDEPSFARNAEQGGFAINYRGRQRDA